MITFFKGVLVVRLWRWNNFQAELCVFPPNKQILPHKHEDENIELVHIWGSADYYRYSTDDDCRTYSTHPLKDFLRSFTIPANYSHGANIKWTGLVTLSCQRWTTKPSSVTVDYTEAKI